MNNLFFWIIVCSWLIPMGIRMYNRSKARRLQNGNFPGPDYRQHNLPGPGYPPQGYPARNYPGYPSGPAVIRPADEAPQAAPPSNPSPNASFPNAGPEPQGYRAKKLAELDAKFTNGQIAMEDYMKQRQEIMNG
ncbi:MULTISPECIES: hypothetical protein [Paenarthrobacter]|uniref:hypothetical protein n=1 Tax=Paenarthrobacter TaxID=1742992 RepID=UPI00236697D6|nr:MULTISPECIES: hypothetical protein [Paenarthrobacter]MDD7836588.1 hypothetical protein [Paenarthrobacter sp. AB444]MDP9934465.1 hypothetical protein [Paenarthrobacter nicotinovorans]